MIYICMGETSPNGRIITAVFRLVNSFNLAINIYIYDDLCVIYDDIWMLLIKHLLTGDVTID